MIRFLIKILNPTLLFRLFEREGGGIMQKLISKLLLVTAITLLTSGTVIAQSVQYFGNVEIKTSVVYDPGFSTNNVKITPAKKQLKWIQVDIDYDTKAMVNKETKTPRWLENVVMKYDVLLPRVSGSPRVVLSGNVEYWALPMDGETHHAQVFIHPQILKRYVPNLKLNKSKMKELRLMLTFELNESPVGYGFYKPKSSMSSRGIKGEIDSALRLPSTRKVKNAIFNREETPWGIINLNYYELIKRKN